MVAYVADYVSGDLKAADESDEVGLYRQDEVPWKELAFQSTSDALQDYFSRER